jgi:hypothetical protein
VTLVACSMLIIVNSFDISLLVDHVASACLHRPVSMFWSCLTSIAIKPMALVTLEEGGQGLVVLLDSLSITVLRVVQYGFLQLPSALWRVFYCKGSLTDLRS